MHELCIFCGKCLEVCPVNAKKLRSDIARVKQLINLGYKVIASLAPSFPAEFDCTPEQLISAVKRLGFAGVSETATGAEIVGRISSEKIAQNSKRIISSACPTVTHLIKKYRPELVDYISDIVSPLHAHAAYLKKIYGAEIAVVFIGPCISKKLEADDKNTPIDLAVTFIELQQWLQAENILPTEITPAADDQFIPEKTTSAAEFAVEGGMLNTIKEGTSTIDTHLMSCSGINNIFNTFGDIEAAAADSENTGLFLELLACDGGCISGKGMTSEKGYLAKRLKVIDYFNKKKKENLNQPDAPESIIHPVAAEPVAASGHTEEEIDKILVSLDKTKKEDELNCSGCGYNTCRDFAAALIDGKAEHSMCVTNMRKLAEKKSNALMNALPLGVVITDRNNCILECNMKFIQQFSGIDEELNSRAAEHVEGIAVSKFIPDCSIFERIKSSECGLLEEKIRIEQKIYRTFVFRIGGEDLVGAVFQDITSPAVRRETIIRKTEEVIEKSLSSVQQIASLLGENAAETQLILNSLIESYNETGIER